VGVDAFVGTPIQEHNQLRQFNSSVEHIPIARHGIAPGSPLPGTQGSASIGNCPLEVQTMVAQIQQMNAPCGFIATVFDSYRSALYGPGYTGAILHANDLAGGGVRTVLTGLAEAIKNIEQQKYINGVLTWHLHGCSWELLCEIAQILLEDYGPFVPPQLRRCVPAQLVDVIPEILCGYMSSDFALRRISFHGEESHRADELFGREIM